MVVKLELKVPSELDADVGEEGSFKKPNDLASGPIDPDVSVIDVLALCQVEPLSHALQTEGEEPHFLIELACFSCKALGTR